jgi:hypothetical protein
MAEVPSRDELAKIPTTLVGAPPQLFSSEAACAFLMNPNVEVVIMGGDDDVRHAHAFTEAVQTALGARYPTVRTSYWNTRCDWCGGTITTLGLRLRDFRSWGDRLLPDMCFACAHAESENLDAKHGATASADTGDGAAVGAGAGAGAGAFHIYDGEHLEGLRITINKGAPYACSACARMCDALFAVGNAHGSTFCLACMAKWATLLPPATVHYTASGKPADASDAFDDGDGGVEETKG